MDRTLAAPHLGCLMARRSPEEDYGPLPDRPDKYRGQENQLIGLGFIKEALRRCHVQMVTGQRFGVGRVEWSGTELVVEKPLGFAAGSGWNWQWGPGTSGSQAIKLLKVEGIVYARVLSPLR
jgi:hypothetical protein